MKKEEVKLMLNHRMKKRIMTVIAVIGVMLAIMGCSPQRGMEGMSAPAAEPSPMPAEPAVKTPGKVEPELRYTLMITHSKSDYISFTDGEKGITDKVTAGAFPFGIALDETRRRAYVSTAEGVAVMDTKLHKRLALVPYESHIKEIKFGEYRPGGMGIAVSSDGRYVYVGVYLPGQPSRLEIMDTEKLAMTGSVPVGIRPFDVAVSHDGSEVYSIDHDSYTVTIVNPQKLTARQVKAAPFGTGGGGFEKPHYAIVREDGRLLLPYQGRGLVVLDPAAGTSETEPLTGNTHQEGVSLTPDGKKMLIVGNGAAGSATGKPNLTVLDIGTMEERIIPLDRPHQMAASSPDGRLAYLTGGVTLTGTGWDGLTVVDFSDGTSRELALPDLPLDIAVIKESQN
ncbi:YncE family protein [Paenibacillus sp. OAS669]|uniref:YncE family protein n=1 Tax=Paenibacillus sp. OAS669 TaxID=2663821 RepID=UPI001789E8C9|nr:YncE family protein [Paenibacillus sp. OAS669]MBE1443681.1 DNA-binding beta-propeller fold protein YncE [Paenibacillus sp. OAS669]